MKKFLLFAVIALIAVTAFTSCDKDKKDNGFGIVYSTNIDGEGEGQFQVTFPQGSVAMNGNATLNFLISNDKSILTAATVTKDQILTSGDTEKIKVLNQCADFIATQYAIQDVDTEGSGTYDFWIKGYIMEKMTGLKFEINRHITNKDSLLKSSQSEPLDFIL